MSSWGQELGYRHRAEGIGKGELKPESYGLGSCEGAGQQEMAWRVTGTGEGPKPHPHLTNCSGHS